MHWRGSVAQTEATTQPSVQPNTQGLCPPIRRRMARKEHEHEPSSTCPEPLYPPTRRRMARKEYEYEIVWVGQPNNVRNNTWKGRAELIDMGYAKMVSSACKAG